MSNMSYCRFENTRNDLDDCKDALAEMLDGSGDRLSRGEHEAAEMLVRECLDIIQLIAMHAEVPLDDLEPAHIDRVLAPLRKQ